MDQCHFGCMSKATSRTSLLQIAELAISSFQEAFPTVGLIKKWHWILHLPDLLQRHGHLPNCFTAERKHKTISAYATKLERTSSYEQHLLQQVLPRELMILQEPGMFPLRATLMKPRPANAKQMATMKQFAQGDCHGAMVSSRCKLPTGAQVRNGDALAFRQGASWQIGQAWFHVLLGSIQATLGHRRNAEPILQCLVSQEAGFIPVDAMMFPLVFTMSGEQHATVLLPYQLYHQQ